MLKPLLPISWNSFWGSHRVGCCHRCFWHPWVEIIPSRLGGKCCYALLANGVARLLTILGCVFFADLFTSYHGKSPFYTTIWGDDVWNVCQESWPSKPKIPGKFFTTQVIMASQPAVPNELSPRNTALWRALIHHWCPFIRPASKPFFLRRTGYVRWGKVD